METGVLVEDKDEVLSELNKQLQLAIASLEKEYGKGAVIQLGQGEVVAWPSISTGAPNLDLALGIGGFPRGRVVEIYGPESSGKTTLSLSTIAQAQKMGLKCLFIDIEHALDPAYAQALGVNLEDMLFSQPSSGEEALSILDTMISTGEIGVVVVDSVAALVPKAELEGEMSDQQMGLQARMMAKAMRKIVARISETQTLVIFINQLREKIGVMFGNPETTPGGRALKFTCSVRIDIRKIENLQDKKEGTMSGVKVRAKVIKNKMAPPLKKAEFDIIYGQGVNTLGCIVDMAIEEGIMVKSGSWISYKDESFAQGRDKAVEKLSHNPQLVEEIKEQIYADARL